MMDSMIERVAKAVYKAHPWQTDYLEGDPTETSWEDCPDRDKEECRTIARAAIEAMREPTDAVREIMGAHASNGFVNWNDYHDAMIDAALAH